MQLTLATCSKSKEIIINPNTHTHTHMKASRAKNNKWWNGAHGKQKQTGMRMRTHIQTSVSLIAAWCIPPYTYIWADVQLEIQYLKFKTQTDVQWNGV